MYEWVEGNYFRKVAELSDEDSFGEQALDFKQRRNATVKAKGDVPVHLAVLSKDEYEKSISRLNMKKTNKTIEFLQNIPCFRA